MSKEKILNPLAQSYSAPTPTLPDPIDTLKREDYPSRAAWLEACADLAMKRNTPEFRKAFYDMERKADRRDFEAAQAKLQEESRKMISSVKLSEREVKKIDERATAEIMEKVKRGFRLLKWQMPVFHFLQRCSFRPVKKRCAARCSTRRCGKHTARSSCHRTKQAHSSKQSEMLN